MQKLKIILLITAFFLRSSIVSAATRQPLASQDGLSSMTLEANKTMPALVKDKASRAPVTAQSLNGLPTGTSLARAVADNAYVHSLGSKNVAPDGTVSASSIGKLLATASHPITLKLSSGEHLPANSARNIAMPDSLLNRVMIDADGQLMSAADEDSSNASWNGGNLSRQVGDGVLVRAFEPKFGIVRDREYNSPAVFNYNTKRMLAPITSDFMTNNAQWNTPPECASSSRSGYNEYWCDRHNWGVSMHNNTLNTTSNVGSGIVNNQMKSTGWGYGGAFDVEEMERFLVGGTNWHWVGVSEMDEIDAMTPGGYSLDAGNTVIQSGARNYLEEKNLSGYGPEDPRTAWDPTYTTRIPYWFNAWYPGNAPVWTANTSYNAFQVIVISHNGTDYMYEATAQGGKTGAKLPNFQFNESTYTVTDGTQKWIFVGKKTFQIGRVFGIGATDGIQFGTLMSPGTSTFYNSILDFSQANYTANIPAVLRTHTNTYFDLSADGTKNGQNNHLLGYGHYNGVGGNTLEYNVNGQLKWHVNDAGFIGSPVGAYSAAGTEITGATPINSPIAEIYSASSDNAGVIEQAIGKGEQFTVYNYSGHPIRIYPNDKKWKINGVSPYYTLQNKEWASGYIANIHNIYIHSSNHNWNLWVDGSLYLKPMAKAAILSLPSPTEGQTAYDSDDHAQVTYRCPTSSKCAWFPVQYGSPLSN